MQASKTAIYARVSTEEQLKGTFTSIDSQISFCKKYLAADFPKSGIPTIYKDEGYTARNTNRPAFQNLLNDARHGKLNLLIIYKIDRLTREDLEDSLKTIRIIKEYGVDLKVATEDFDTSTPDGKTWAHMKLVWSHAESLKIGERVRNKFISMVENGLFIGGRPPLGYNITEKKLIINQAERDIVELIFKEYMNLKSARKVAHKLNNMSLKAKSFRVKKGKNKGKIRGGGKYYQSHILPILTNPIYIGKISHKNSHYKGIHQGMISESIFNKVAKILKHNQVIRKTASQNTYKRPLSGLLYCKKTGSRLTPVHARKKNGMDYFYYKSVFEIKKGKKYGHLKPIPASLIENLIFDNLEHLGKEKKLLESTLSAYENKDKKAKNEIGKSVALLRANLKKTNMDLDGLVNFVMKNSSAKNSNTILKKMEDLELEKTNLEEQINQQQVLLQNASISNIEKDNIISVFSNFKTLIGSIPEEKMNGFLSLIIRDIQVTRDEGIINFWKTQPELLDVGKKGKTRSKPQVSVNHKFPELQLRPVRLPASVLVTTSCIPYKAKLPISFIIKWGYFQNEEVGRFLKTKYLDEKLSLREIARQLNISKQFAQSILRHWNYIRSFQKSFQGQVPFGSEIKQGKLVPNEKEKKTVRAVLDMRNDGLSLDRIAENLTYLAVPTKNGRRWHRNTLKKIIDFNS